MASGDNKKGPYMSTGTYTCTGAAVDIICGFRPRYIKVWNLSGICTGEWFSEMTDAHVLKAVDSGAGAVDLSEASSDGITPLFNGFTLGADTDLNVNTEVIHWVAFK